MYDCMFVYCIQDLKRIDINKGGMQPYIFKVDKPGIQADILLCLAKLLAQSVLGAFNCSLSVKLGIFPIFCQHWHSIIS